MLHWEGVPAFDAEKRIPYKICLGLNEIGWDTNMQSPNETMQHIK